MNRALYGLEAVTHSPKNIYETQHTNGGENE